jgi:uncharacterized protein YrrD
MFELTANTSVYSAHDEHVGKIDYIVMDPLTTTVTHFVVRKGVFFPEDKVIPVGAIATATAERVNLRQDVDPEEFLPFLEFHYVPIGTVEQAADAPGPSPIPVAWYGPHGIMTPMYDSTMRTVIERNIPERALALEPGTPVYAKDRSIVGELDEVVLTDTGVATHVVLVEDGFNPIRRAIPIAWIDAISETEIRLGTTRRMVESIDPYNPADPRNDG